MCNFKRCDFKVFRGQWVNILCIYREGELVRELSLLKVKKKQSVMTFLLIFPH